MSKNSSPPAEDLRIRRTRKLIWEALLSLLQEQPFATISVRTISERAMVHRATFYTHFQDKYALIDYGIRETFQKVIQELHWEEASEQRSRSLLPVFEYMRAHRELFSLLLVEKGPDSLGALIRRHMVEVMEAELLCRSVAQGDDLVGRTRDACARRGIGTLYGSTAQL